MKKYAQVKSTNTPWFENTASHWLGRRLSTCVSSLQSGAREQSKASEVDGIPNLGGEHIGKDGLIIRKGMRFISKEFYNAMRSGVIKEKDLLLVKDGATIGKISYINTMPYPECSVNEHVYILRTKRNEDTKYIYYLFRSLPIQEQIWLNVRGSAQPGLTAQFLKNIDIHIPAMDEQTKIARYLDYKNYQINKYIRITKRQIELLKELKQTIINDAVTGKIDVRTGKPYPKYKDSGVDWLGMIPDGWQHSTLAKVSSLIVDGTHFSPKSFESGDFMYITAKNIKEHGVDLSDVSYISSSDHEPIYRRCPVKQGDVLYIKDGATAGIATINKIEEQFSLLSSVALIRTLNHLNPRYLVYFLNSMVFKSHLLSSLTGGAMTRFTIDKLKKYNVLYPSSDLQLSIIDYLNSHIEKFNSKINTLNRSIELLSSLQTRLISDVVSGKLDVRDVDIPEFKEENEDHDEAKEESYIMENNHVQD